MFRYYNVSYYSRLPIGTAHLTPLVRLEDYVLQLWVLENILTLEYILQLWFRLIFCNYGICYATKYDSNRSLIVH